MSGDYQIALRYNDLGLDDVVVKNVAMFRMERMSEDRFWLACYLTDGQEIVFSIAGIDVRVSVRPDLPNVVYEEGSLTAEQRANLSEGESATP